MRALMVTTMTFPETNFSKNLASIRASLRALDISFHRVSVEALPSSANINDYDFVLIPQVANGSVFNSFINNTGITLPFLVLDVGGSMASTNIGSNPGVSGSSPSHANNFVTASWMTTEWFAAYARYWTLTTGTALMSASTTEPLTGGAQADAGKVCMWKTSRASGASMMYIANLYNPLMPAFPLLLQAAIDAGDFTAAQIATLRRVPVVLDLDHVNNDTFRNDPTRLDKFLSYIPSGGVVWAGIYNAADTDITSLGTTATALRDKLLAEQGKRLKFCYHTHHSTRIQPTTGTFPYAAQGGTLADAVNKTNQASYYSTDKGLWEGVGLSFADAPLYYNNGAYRFNDDTLALFSPDSSLASSPGNNTTQAGYGYTVFRAGRDSSRVAPGLNTRVYNQRAVKQTMRGIMMLSPEDVCAAYDAPFNTVALWMDKFKMMTQAVSYEISMLIHDWTFTLPQDPDGANGYAGEVVMQMITDMRNHLSFCDYFADPTLYWHPRSVTM